MGTAFGWIGMLGRMGGRSGGMDMGAFTGGGAVALITTLYELVFAFCFFPCNTTSNIRWTRTLKAPRWYKEITKICELPKTNFCL